MQASWENPGPVAGQADSVSEGEIESFSGKNCSGEKYSLRLANEQSLTTFMEAPGSTDLPD
jgi:hypothetical protein